MTTLSPISAKQLARLKQAGKVRKGTFIIDVKDAKERQDAIGRGIREVLFGKKVAPKSERSRAMAEADKWFSLFIRLRDSDANGIATCITSGKRAHWTTMDCGHYVSRAKQSTRYDERNCNAQGKMANRFQGGHFVEHGNAIDRKYGEGASDALRSKGLMRCSRTTSDFLFLASTYRSRVERIRETEPGKYNAEG